MAPNFHLPNKITSETLRLTLIRIVRQNSLWSVHNLRMARKIGNIAKQYKYLRIASNTHQSSTSERERKPNLRNWWMRIHLKLVEKNGFKVLQNYLDTLRNLVYSVRGVRVLLGSYYSTQINHLPSLPSCFNAILSHEHLNALYCLIIDKGPWNDFPKFA